LILDGFPVGLIGANCYLIGCEETHEGAIIDPGADGKRILSRLEKLPLQCRQIILTHGHTDHIGALSFVQKATGAAVLIHTADAAMLTNLARNVSFLERQRGQGKAADRLLQEGDLIEVGKIPIKVIHTPGHTPGGICLTVDNILFTGDTLFAGSIGRTDFPGGSHRQLIESIKKELLAFPPETIVYPGHGPATTIGEEKKYNPFLTGRW
jgi:glyoxylase-like metal-dependent hydrolase (beta-lactamase superfamily II)